MKEKPTTKKIVEVGCNQPVFIEKMFGPTIFADLKVVADFERGGWVIQREMIATGEYKEWAFVPAQLEEDFEEQEIKKPFI